MPIAELVDVHRKLVKCCKTGAPVKQRYCKQSCNHYEGVRYHVGINCKYGERI